MSGKKFFQLFFVLFFLQFGFAINLYSKSIQAFDAIYLSGYKNQITRLKINFTDGNATRENWTLTRQANGTILKTTLVPDSFSVQINPQNPYQLIFRNRQNQVTPGRLVLNAQRQPIYLDVYNFRYVIVNNSNELLAKLDTQIRLINERANIQCNEKSNDIKQRLQLLSSTVNDAKEKFSQIKNDIERRKVKPNDKNIEVSIRSKNESFRELIRLSKERLLSLKTEIGQAGKMIIYIDETMKMPIILTSDESNKLYASYRNLKTTVNAINIVQISAYIDKLTVDEENAMRQIEKKS